MKFLKKFFSLDIARSFSLVTLWLWLPVLVIGVSSTSWDIDYVRRWIFALPLLGLGMFLTRFFWFKAFYLKNAFDDDYRRFKMQRMK